MELDIGCRSASRLLAKKEDEPSAEHEPTADELLLDHSSANSYLVDTYTQYGASAMASKTFIRSLAGASVPM